MPGTFAPRPLRAGDLRERVTIQTPTTASDGQGGVTTSWAALANGTVWARVSYTAGGDQSEPGQTVPRRQYDVTIRKRTDVTQKMRVVRGAQTLEILAINDSTDYRDARVLTCEELP